MLDLDDIADAYVLKRQAETVYLSGVNEGVKKVLRKEGVDEHKEKVGKMWEKLSEAGAREGRLGAMKDIVEGVLRRKGVEMVREEEVEVDGVGRGDEGGEDAGAFMVEEDDGFDADQSSVASTTSSDDSGYASAPYDGVEESGRRMPGAWVDEITESFGDMELSSAGTLEEDAGFDGAQAEDDEVEDAQEAEEDEAVVRPVPGQWPLDEDA